MLPRRIVQVIGVAQSENIMLRFLRHGHDEDGCSCNHRTASARYAVGVSPVGAAPTTSSFST